MVRFLSLPGVLVDQAETVPSSRELTLGELKILLDSVSDRLTEVEDSGVGNSIQRRTFTTPQATWTWVHNLGGKPWVVMTIDGQGELIPDVNYLSNNVLTIEHDTPVTGYLDIG